MEMDKMKVEPRAYYKTSVFPAMWTVSTREFVELQCIVKQIKQTKVAKQNEKITWQFGLRYNEITKVLGKCICYNGDRLENWNPIIQN